MKYLRLLFSCGWPLLFAALPQATAQSLYWSQPGASLHARDLATGAAQLLFETGPFDANNDIPILCFDTLHQRIYFVLHTVQADRLMAVAVAGGEPTVLSDHFAATSLVYHHGENRLYYTVSSGTVDAVGIRYLDLSTGEDGLVYNPSGLVPCYKLGLDEDDGMLYFTQGTGQERFRIRTDGTGLAPLGFLPPPIVFSTGNYVVHPLTHGFFLSESPLAGGCWMLGTDSSGAVLDTVYAAPGSLFGSDRLPDAPFVDTKAEKLYFFVYRNNVFDDLETRIFCRSDPDGGNRETLDSTTYQEASDIHRISDWVIGYVTPVPAIEQPFTVKHFSVFRSDPLRTFEADGFFAESAELCADGADVSYFDIRPTDTSGVALAAISMRIGTDPMGLQPDMSGAFSFDFRYGPTLRFRYRHPRQVESNGLSGVLTVEIFDQGSGAVYTSFELDVYRPPVLFVHGLWSNGEAAFSTMEDSLSASGLYDGGMLLAADYEATNDFGFQVNDAVVGEGIRNLKAGLLARGISVGKADLVCHSMGGLLARMYVAGENYRDDIRKLITLNAPHFGSQMANLLLDPGISCLGLCAWLELAGVGSCFNGAVNDLQVSQAAITTLGDLAMSDVYLHAVETNETVANLSGFVFALRWRVALLQLAALASLNVDEWLVDLFEDPFHDLVVSATSQRGGLSGESVSSVPAQFHMGAAANPTVIGRVRELLAAHPDSADFTRSGYDLSQNTLNYIPSELCDNYSATGTLSLESPPAGQYLSAGNPVQFEVTGNGEIARIELHIEEAGGYHTVSAEGNVLSAGYQPGALPLGPRDILVTGYDGADIPVQLVHTQIVVGTDQVPVSIYPASGRVSVGWGAEIPVRFLAVFPDFTGSLSEVDSVDYHFRSGKAGREGRNRVRGDLPGYDTLTVTYRGVESLPMLIHVYDPADFEVTPTAEIPGDDRSLLLRRLYPNPGRADLFLDMHSARPQPVRIAWYDLYGREIGTLPAELSAGENHIRIPWAEGRPAGLYLLVVRSGSSVRTTRFIRY